MRNVIHDSSSDDSDSGGDDSDHTAEAASTCTDSTEENIIITNGTGSSSESPSSQKINDSPATIAKVLDECIAELYNVLPWDHVSPFLASTLHSHVQAKLHVKHQLDLHEPQLTLYQQRWDTHHHQQLLQAQSFDGISRTKAAADEVSTAVATAAAATAALAEPAAGAASTDVDASVGAATSGGAKSPAPATATPASPVSALNVANASGDGGDTGNGNAINERVDVANASGDGEDADNRNGGHEKEFVEETVQAAKQGSAVTSMIEGGGAIGDEDARNSNGGHEEEKAAETTGGTDASMIEGGGGGNLVKKDRAEKMDNAQQRQSHRVNRFNIQNMCLHPQVDHGGAKMRKHWQVAVYHYCSNCDKLNCSDMFDDTATHTRTPPCRPKIYALEKFIEHYNDAHGVVASHAHTQHT